MDGQILGAAAAGAAGVLLLPVLDVVPYRLIAELNSAADRLRIDLARLNLRQYRLRALQERLLDVLSSLGARLEENQIVLLSKVAGFQERHLPRLLEVLFVADEDDDDVWAGEGACVVQPVREGVEGLARRRVVH